MPLQTLIAFTLFFFALGACIGSFLNVVIWRLPNYGREVLFLAKRGPLTLNWPPSHCPVCDAPIRWYQNIPIFSYIALKARCANCKTHIPIRYPLVELGTALLFAGYFLASFAAHWQTFSIPGHWQAFPTFYDLHDPHQSAALVLHLIFIAALLAASAIDIDLFIIPLSIPWFLIILALVACPFIDHPAIWKLNASQWHLARPILGGTLGLLVSNLLISLKLIPRSFSEPQTAPPTTHDASPPIENQKSKIENPLPPLSPPPKLTRFAPSVIISILLILASVLAWITLAPKPASLLTVIAGILIFLIGVLPRDKGQTDVTNEVLEEISGPFVRREIIKELPFLAVPILCAAIAYLIPFNLPPSDYLARLLGSLFGILIGGGIVWIIRIAGTLAFNKEAMGMGDAHLMAAVGAILGPTLVVIAFFTAPFIGILWAVILICLKKPNVLPYGPWLSIAAILSLLLGNPLLAWYLHILAPNLL